MSGTEDKLKESLKRQKREIIELKRLLREETEIRDKEITKLREEVSNLSNSLRINIEELERLK